MGKQQLLVTALLSNNRRQDVTGKVLYVYGRNRVGQSVLLARRLIEAGCRFVTASGYRHRQWDTQGQ